MGTFIRTIVSILFMVAVTRDCAAEEPFKLGVGVCLTGGCAEWGGAALKGIKLAVDEINSAGGILSKPIELVTEDTKEATTGASAVTAFQRLLGEKDIRFIIGPSWSPAGTALIPVLSKRLDVVVITPSMAIPDFARASDNLFKMVPDNATTAERIAEYAIQKNLKSMAIISNQLAAEKYTSEKFQKKYESLGGTIVGFEETTPEEIDLRTPVLRLIRNKPEAVFLANYVQIGPTARRLQELGYKGALISILLDQTRIDESAGALNGAVFSNYVSYSAQFAEKFKSRYGEAYGPSADSAYDTVYVLKEAIQNAHSFDPSVVKTIIPTLKMQGTASPIRFNQYRTVEKEPLLFKVVEGRAQPMDDK